LGYTVEGVSMPAPTSVSKRGPAKIEAFDIDGDEPVIIVPGLQATEVIIDGVLVGDKDTIESTYLVPLEALKGTVVTVEFSFTGTRYDGDWILSEVSYREVDAKRFTYSLRLTKGSSYIVL
jgi:hypothetical protein